MGTESCKTVEHGDELGGSCCARCKDSRFGIRYQDQRRPTSSASPRRRRKSRCQFWLRAAHCLGDKRWKPTQVFIAPEIVVIKIVASWGVFGP
jgi:hypothetical protein